MKKYLKIIALATALILIGGLAYFAVAFLGNPLSKLLAERAAHKHVEENYSDQDVYVDSVMYSFKTGDYFARVKSETSADTYFTIYLDWWGHVKRDTYESAVLSKSNTATRLDNEYREMTREILTSSAFSYEYDFGSGSLNILYDEYDQSEYDFGLLMSELELDKIYDVRALGAELGVLTVYLHDENPTVERTAEMALTIKQMYDEAGIPFQVLDLNVRRPKPEEGPWSELQIYAELNYDEIYEEGMTERVQQAHDEKVAYYAELDKQGK